MFKRWLISGLAALVLVSGIVGMVLAQEPQPPVDTPDAVPSVTCPFDGICPLGKEDSSGYQHGRMGHAHHGGAYAQRGTLPALLAETLGMTEEALIAALAEGTPSIDVIVAQGFEVNDVVTLLIAPRVAAIETSVAEGPLTQEQADLMIAQMEARMQLLLEQGFSGGTRGFGGGGKPLHGDPVPSECAPQGGRGGRQGGRWQNTPPQPQWNAPSS